MNKEEKALLISSLIDSFVKSQATVLFDNLGLTVAQMTTLRRDLRKAGCEAKVVKNTLARLSTKKSLKEKKGGEMDRFLGTLKGPTVAVFSYKDPIVPTKILAAFAKGNDKLKIKSCWLDGQFVDPAGVQDLSKMPGREETLAMLLSLLNAPATKLLRLMKEPGSQVARVVEAQRKNLGGE